MDAIVLAAGRSVRMGEGNVKQLMRIGGKPMLVFAIERLLDHPEIDRVVLTVPDERRGDVETVLASYRLDPHVEPVAGGRTRQESVQLALAHVRSERVLVHEAARPVISRALVDRVVSADGAAVVPVVEIPFTVAIGDDVMRDEIERDSLRNVQLPQAFDTEVLRAAHDKAVADGATATEDAQLVFRLGETVRFVAGAVENIKVTYPADVVIAHEWIFGQSQEDS